MARSRTSGAAYKAKDGEWFDSKKERDDHNDYIKIAGYTDTRGKYHPPKKASRKSDSMPKERRDRGRSQYERDADWLGDDYKKGGSKYDSRRYGTEAEKRELEREEREERKDRNRRTFVED